MKSGQRINFIFFCAALIALTPASQAQSVAATSCGSLKSAMSNPAQQVLLRAYLQGYANAGSPDPHFTQSDTVLSGEAQKVSDWCNAHAGNTYGEAVAAIIGPAASHAPTPAATAPAPAGPTSCRVGPTTYCAGCSVACSGGKQATCELGRDSDVNKWCLFQARCVCK